MESARKHLAGLLTIGAGLPMPSMELCENCDASIL